MPRLNEAIASASNLVGYTPVPAQPAQQTLPHVDTDGGPTRNSMIRCPIPTLWNDSSDSQRQFYMGGQVPQMRILTPPRGSVSSAGSSGGNAVTIQGGGSSPSGSSSNPPTAPTVAAAQASMTTSLLTPGASFAGTIPVSRSLQLLAVSVSSPCRVQMYGTRLAQLQDTSRGLDDAPPAGVMQNLISDVVLDTAPFLWSWQNRVAANADNPQGNVLYVTVTNLDVLSDTVTLTLQYVPIES